MIGAVSGSQIASAELVTTSLPEGHRVLFKTGCEVKDVEVTEPFIKYTKSESSEFLHKHPIANHVLLIIAYRARRTPHPSNGLQPGQCFMGDYGVIGITRQQYRTAISNLRKWQHITTKTTNRGTIVTLLTTTVYDINIETQPTDQPSNNQQLTNSQPLTKNVKNDKKKAGFTKPLKAMSDKELCQVATDRDIGTHGKTRTELITALARA